MAQIINDSKSGKKHELFSLTFGMWKGRDIDLKKIRQQAFERRTRTSSVEQAGDKLSLSVGMWKDRDIDAKELRCRASGIDKRLGLTGK